MEGQERHRLEAFLSPKSLQRPGATIRRTGPRTTPSTPGQHGDALTGLATSQASPRRLRQQMFAMDDRLQETAAARPSRRGFLSKEEEEEEAAFPLLRPNVHNSSSGAEGTGKDSGGAPMLPRFRSKGDDTGDSLEAPGSNSNDSLGARPPYAFAQTMPHPVTILVLVFLDLFAVGLAMPLVVPLIRDLGANPVELGILSSIYGVVQLISGPYLGLVSDSRGRRLVILLSSMGTCVGYFLLGQSTNFTMLALSRVITGLLKHSINATKSYIADHTSGTYRAIELGRMATASGLGIMVGPTVGGLLFKLGGYGLPTTLASIIYLINCAIVLTRLPPNELPPAVLKESACAPPSKEFLPRVTMLARPRVAALFAVRGILGLAIQIFRQGFAARIIYSFKLSVQSNGLLLSYQGALTSLVQGFAIKPLVQRYNDEPLILRSMILLSASFVLCSVSPSVFLVALTLTPVALATGVLRTTYTALLTATVPPAEVGQLLGLSDAVMSACRVMGPTLAGLVAQRFGHMAPGILSGVLTLIATFFFQVFIHRYSTELLKDGAEPWENESVQSSEFVRLLSSTEVPKAKLRPTLDDALSKKDQTTDTKAKAEDGTMLIDEPIPRKHVTRGRNQNMSGL